jgi:hypothetical protein
MRSRDSQQDLSRSNVSRRVDLRGPNPIRTDLSSNTFHFRCDMLLVFETNPPQPPFAKGGEGGFPRGDGQTEQY